MMQRNHLFSLLGGLILLLLPLQSLVDAQLLKKHRALKDCVPPASTHCGGGCSTCETALHDSGGYATEYGEAGDEYDDTGPPCGSDSCGYSGGGCGCGPVCELPSEYTDGSPVTDWEPNAAFLTVNVPAVGFNTPEETVLMVNGDPTKAEGPSRRFVVRNLDPTKEYKFKLVAITKNRAEVELADVQEVTLNDGDHKTITLKPIRRWSIVAQELAEAEKKASGDLDDAGEENSEEGANDLSQWVEDDNHYGVSFAPHFRFD